MAVPNFEGNILFALFSCPSIFDRTPLHIATKRDCLTGEAFKIFLETEIVRKLCARDFAFEEGSGPVIADFRHVPLIRHIEGDVKGFINALLKEALKLPSFLKYSNNNSAKHLYIHTLTLPRIRQHDFEVRTIQQLLDLSMSIQSNNNDNPLKFKLIPSRALIIQLPQDQRNGYTKVTPNLEIDLTKLVEDGGASGSDTGGKLDLVSIVCSTQGQLTTLVRCGPQGEDCLYMESYSSKIHKISEGSKFLRDAASSSRSQSSRDFIHPKFRRFFSDALLYIYAPRPPRMTLYNTLKNWVLNAVSFATCYMVPLISKDEEMDIPSTPYESNERTHQNYPDPDTQSAEEGTSIDHTRFATTSTLTDSVKPGATTTSDVPVILIHSGLKKSFAYVTQESVPDVCGENGIKLLRNSCYVDTALVSFFFCTDILDDLVFDIKKTDLPLTREIKADIIDIVNELRSAKFVEGDQVMQFRLKLIQQGNFTPKLSGAFMDAEQFLFILFKKALQLPPFIHYTNGMSDFLHQIFLPKPNTQLNMEVATVQELFDLSMRHNGNLKLTKRPNPALIILLPRSNGKLMGRLQCILPSLTLDLTSAMQASRKCIRCDAIATLACYLCTQDEDNIMVTCGSEECLKIERRRHQKLPHCPNLINIDQSNPDETRMKLIAVVCVATFHYTAFVRCGNEWLYYDSMVPSITKIEGGNDILDENERHYNAGEYSSIYWPDGNMRRIFKDCYYCIYVPAPAETAVESLSKQEEMDITPCVSRHEIYEPMQQNYLKTQSAEECSRTCYVQTATEPCNRGVDIVNPEAVATVERKAINSGYVNFDGNTFGRTTSDDSVRSRGLQQSQTTIGASQDFHSSRSVTTLTEFNVMAKPSSSFPSPHVQPRNYSPSASQYNFTAGPVTGIENGAHEIRSSAHQGQRTYSQVAAVRPTQSFRSNNVPAIPPGLRKPCSHIAQRDVRYACGSKKGIKFYENSSYVDTALFSFFFCTDILDDLAFEIKVSDEQLTREIKLDIFDIVNKLRSAIFVGGDQVMRFRQKLIQRGNFTPKLSGAYMDAEEFLYILFKKTLLLPPFIHYATGASDFLHQIFLPISQLKMEVATVQELFELSMMYNGDLKLTQRPNPALIILLPRSKGKLMGRLECILPSLTLDLTSVMQDGRKCFGCNSIATRGCSECTRVKNNDMVSCTRPECMKTLETLHETIPHGPKFINIDPPNPDENRMKLIGVVCVANFHNTAFVRCDDEWLSFNSAGPSITKIEDGNKILTKNEQNHNKGSKISKEQMGRIFTECYYCIYGPFVHGSSKATA